MRWHYYCDTFCAKNLVRHRSFTKSEKLIEELHSVLHLAPQFATQYAFIRKQDKLFDYFVKGRTADCSSAESTAHISWVLHWTAALNSCNSHNSPHWWWSNVQFWSNCTMHTKATNIPEILFWLGNIWAVIPSWMFLASHNQF